MLEVPRIRDTIAVPPDDLVLKDILGLLIQFVGQLVDPRCLIREGDLITHARHTRNPWRKEGGQFPRRI